MANDQTGKRPEKTGFPAHSAIKCHTGDARRWIETGSIRSGRG